MVKGVLGKGLTREEGIAFSLSIEKVEMLCLYTHRPTRG